MLRWPVLALGVMLCVAAPAQASDASPTASDLNRLGVEAAREGRFEAGVAYLRQALQAEPGDVVLRRNLSGVLTDWALLLERDGQLPRAEALLKEAAALDSANARALVRLGDLAYFKRSEFSAALDYWKRAYGRLPASDRRLVADRISQARRDQAIEGAFGSSQTEHFDIRGRLQDDVELAALGNLLEESHGRLSAVFGRGPARITVIIYTARDLQRTYYQRDWAVGFYDGRLRMRRDEVGAEWARPFVLHELTHAFLHEVYGDAMPIWVHEGFAQLQEGTRPRSEEEQRWERAIASGGDWVPLKWLDRRFTHPADRADVGKAYVQARLVIEVLLARHGIGRFKTFLAELSKGTPVEAAYNTAFRPDQWSRTDRSIIP
jgi:tetratricopeptide (TPR) repeat protein